MMRWNCEELVSRLALATGSVALVAVSMAAAQTTTTTKPVVKPAPAVVKTTAKPVGTTAVAKPVATTAPAAKPAAMKSATPTASSVVTPASSQTPMPIAGQTVTSPSTTSTAPSNFLTNPNVSNTAQQYTGGSQTGGARSAVATQGYGTFLWGDATLTVYGCFRTGYRVLCDFDITKQNNAQLNAPWVYGGVNLVDDGGKVTNIHTAFFMGQDGSQFPTAYVSTNPVRMLMEYDNVGANYTSVALVYGPNRIQGVPITPVDPNLPAGAVPGRGAGTTASASAPGSATGSTPIDGASNAVNNATNTINTTKQKSKSLWDSLKSATTTTTK